MTLNRLLGALRRYWYVVAAGALLGALAAGLLVRLMPATYEASSTVLLSAPKTASPVDGSTYLDNRMPTYAELIRSPPVLDEAARILGTSADRDILAERTTAFVPDATSLLVLTARGADPRSAADLSNAVTKAFVELAPGLDNPARPLLQVEVLEEAEPPKAEAGFSPVLLLGVGLVLGTTAGLLVALVAASRRQRT